MTEQVERWICIKFGVQLECSSAEIIQMIQKATAMGNWWLAASSQQHTWSCITSHAQFFCKTSNHSSDSAPLQPRFGALQLLAFPKTKITFEREQISDSWWDSGKYDGAADGNWENCVRSQGASLWKGTEASLSCVQCFSYLLSSSTNVPIFHMTWLDTFWTGLVYLLVDGGWVWAPCTISLSCAPHLCASLCVYYKSVESLPLY